MNERQVLFIKQNIIPSYIYSHNKIKHELHRLFRKSKHEAEELSAHKNPESVLYGPMRQE